MTMTTTSTLALQTLRPEFTANTWTANAQRLPEVLHLSSGGFVVAYASGAGNSFGGDPLLDFYGPDSQPLYATPRVPYTNPANIFTYTPMSLLELSNGNVLFAWTNFEAGHEGIRASIFTPDGGYVSVDETLVSGYAFDPQLVQLPEGGFALAYWKDSTIFLRRFDAGGAPQGSAIEVSSHPQGIMQRDPGVTMLTDGAFVVTFTEKPNGSGDTSIHARIFNPDWTPRTDELTIDAVGDNTAPKITALPNGKWAVAYSDTGLANESGSPGISLKILSHTGASVTGN